MDKDNSIKTSDVGKKYMQLRVKGETTPKDISPDKRRRGVIFLRPHHWADNLATQELISRSYCERHDIEVVDVYSYLGDNVAELDIYQGWGISPILEYCESHPGEIDVFVVDRRDRLGTNTGEYLKCKIDLLQKGVEILAASDIEPLDSSMEEICEIVAKYEKDSNGGGQTV